MVVKISGEKTLCTQGNFFKPVYTGCIAWSSVPQHSFLAICTFQQIARYGLQPTLSVNLFYYKT